MENIPAKIFLDTNVVNFILDHGDQIHDGCAPSSKLTQRVIRDINALQDIWLTGQRANWQIVISQHTLVELRQTRNVGRRKGLLSWASEIIEYQGSLEESESGILPAPITTREQLSILPDISDRILVQEAIKAECDTFCTRDWKTMLRFRDRLQLLPIRIMAPHEWWEQIKPFAVLWA
jgi:predicted nucleic acid-binding protein